jgi:hypothetical protein
VANQCHADLDLIAGQLMDRYGFGVALGVLGFSYLGFSYIVGMLALSMLAEPSKDIREAPG